MDDKGTVHRLGRVGVDHLRMARERKWHGDIQDEISILHQQRRKRDFMSACVVLINNKREGERCAC